MINRPTLRMPIRSISLEFSLTHQTARSLTQQRNGEEIKPETTEGEEPAPLRFRVVSPEHLYGVSAYLETRTVFDEVSWKHIGEHDAVRFGGGSFDSSAIISLAFQRLMAVCSEQFTHAIVNDGKAAKYDLGTL